MDSTTTKRHCSWVWGMAGQAGPAGGEAAPARNSPATLVLGALMMLLVGVNLGKILTGRSSDGGNERLSTRVNVLSVLQVNTPVFMHACIRVALSGGDYYG